MKDKSKDQDNSKGKEKLFASTTAIPAISKKKPKRNAATPPLDRRTSEPASILSPRRWVMSLRKPLSAADLDEVISKALKKERKELDSKISEEIAALQKLASDRTTLKENIGRLKEIIISLEFIRKESGSDTSNSDGTLSRGSVDETIDIKELEEKIMSPEMEPSCAANENIIPLSPRVLSIIREESISESTSDRALNSDKRKSRHPIKEKVENLKKELVDKKIKLAQVIEDKKKISEDIQKLQEEYNIAQTTHRSLMNEQRRQQAEKAPNIFHCLVNVRLGTNVSDLPQEKTETELSDPSEFHSSRADLTDDGQFSSSSSSSSSEDEGSVEELSEQKTVKSQTSNADKGKEKVNDNEEDDDKELSAYLLMNSFSTRTRINVYSGERDEENTPESDLRTKVQ